MDLVIIEKILLCLMVSFYLMVKDSFYVNIEQINDFAIYPLVNNYAQVLEISNDLNSDSNDIYLGNYYFFVGQFFKVFLNMRDFNF